MYQITIQPEFVQALLIVLAFGSAVTVVGGVVFVAMATWITIKRWRRNRASGN